jgi:hypothetical protein
MGMRKRTGMCSAGDEAGEMGHVDEEFGADLIGNFAKAAEIDEPGIGRSTGDDDLWAVLARELCHLLEVDPMVIAAHAVGYGLEPAPRHVHGRAMGQVAAGGKVEAQERVARRHQGHEGGGIGRRARVRLNVCELTSEKPRKAFNRKVFNDVDMLAAAVIAPPWQSLRIFVGQDRPLRFQDRLADDVFRGNELDLVALARELALDHVGHFGIGLRERGREQIRDIGVGSRRIGHGMSHCCCRLILRAWRFAGPIAYPVWSAKLWALPRAICPHLGVAREDMTMHSAFLTRRRRLGSRPAGACALLASGRAAKKMPRQCRGKGPTTETDDHNR